MKKKVLRFHNIVSTVLHPVVMPTIGLLLYFIYIPIQFSKKQQLLLLAITFIATYILPLLLLFFLKSTGKIKNFKVHSITERKTPILFMICLFLLLAKGFIKTSITIDVAYLFFGTSLGLTLIYFLFLFKIKASLHLMSMGSTIGFFVMNQQFYAVSLQGLITVFILLSGILGSSRLYLKAHKPNEIYIGFFIGVICQFLARICFLNSSFLN